MGTLFVVWALVKHISQDKKWDDVQMIQPISTLGIGLTDKSIFQQVDLPVHLVLLLPHLVSEDGVQCIKAFLSSPAERIL